MPLLDPITGLKPCANKDCPETDPSEFGVRKISKDGLQPFARLVTVRERRPIGGALLQPHSAWPTGMRPDRLVSHVGVHKRIEVVDACTLFIQHLASKHLSSVGLGAFHLVSMLCSSK
jgi:hypothetical protein